MDELLATLGQELRGPLAPILNNLEILRLAGAFDRGPTARACTVIEEQVNSLTRLINSLLELARLGRGGLQVITETIDLASVVRDAVDVGRPLMLSRRHKLVVDYDTPRVWIAGDRLRLMQVFASILNNAAKYTDYGGRIEVTVQRKDHEAIVRVKDNGIGIVSTQLTRVFEMFGQADPSGRRPGGLGIGLTLARGIVAMHAGTIQALSDGPGHGSEFIVRLPRLGHWEGRLPPDSGNSA